MVPVNVSPGPMLVALKVSGVVVDARIYYRGRALLAAGDRVAAAKEFETLIAHANAQPRVIYVPLSKLHLARLYMETGQTANAHALVAELEQQWSTVDPGFAPLREVHAVDLK
jgi:hypothetical protein